MLAEIGEGDPVGKLSLEAHRETLLRSN
jgi:hypothetical protein